MEHGTLQDGHAGTVANALWARALTLHLRSEAALRVTPITEDEIDAFVEKVHAEQAHGAASTQCERAT